VADYSKSVEQVYQDATEYMVVEEHSPIFLYFFDSDPTTRDFDAPSWVPLYDRPFDIPGENSSFAQAPVQCSPHMSIDGDVLTIQALILDFVSISTMNFSKENMQHLVLDFVSKLPDEHRQQVEENRLSGLWQTLVGYRPKIDDGTALEQGFLEFISVLPNFNHLVPESQDGIAEHESLENENDFVDDMLVALLSKSAPLGRSVFQTSTGLYGSGPAGRNDIDARAVETGDCVVVFPRTKFIHILRPVEDRMYTMVGNGYIGGIREGWPAFNEVGIPEPVPIRIR
jgi:hypothetical protein